MSIETLLTGQAKDLGGGFVVSRLLPSSELKSVGPFIFFDHFGPLEVQPGANHDVRPHPHIGLATVTYLFDGAMMHRDSLGSAQRIEPGAINWMTAGRGIVHSERAPEDLKGKAYGLHGLQLWVALPAAHEETAPEFIHTPAGDMPEFPQDGAEVRVLVGEAFGRTSPVKTFSSTIYLDISLAAGASMNLPALGEELAIYTVQGDIQVDGQALANRALALLAPGQAVAARRQHTGTPGRHRRRQARRALLRLVEFRLQPPRPHRSGRRGLDGAEDGTGAGRERVHPAARPATAGGAAAGRNGRGLSLATAPSLTPASRVRLNVQTMEVDRLPWLESIPAPA